jgi:Tetratricopeptide repeat
MAENRGGDVSDCHDVSSDGKAPAAGRDLALPRLHVPVSGSQGVQAGEHNTQVNNYFFSANDDLRPAPQSGDGVPAGSGRLEYHRPEVPSRPVRLPPKPPFLAGREDLLAELHAQLSVAERTGPRVAILSGLGGCGKTSVAVEYAHRHEAEFGFVWQFPAEEPASLEAGFGDLAAQLGVRTTLDVGDPVAQVHAVLAAYPWDWLLLFDNAPGPAALKRFLPPIGQGRVLVTSQDPHWPGSRVIEVRVLDLEVAADFVQARTGDADPTAGRELAIALGGLPLALEQAAAYMLVVGRGIADYLRLFIRRRGELLARGEPAGYGRQVATTWTLAFDYLQRTTPQAVALLQLLACCAPDNIPLSLLLRPWPELTDDLPAQLSHLLDDPLAADDALAALRRFSLVSAPRDEQVSVHRLVQAVTLDKLGDGEAHVWREAARTVIEAALPKKPVRPETWPAYSALLSHAEVALPDESPGTRLIASFLGYSGNYAAARTMCERSASANERLSGPEHPDTLKARANLALWTGKTGDAAGARDQYAVLLPLRERLLGPEHPDTLKTRANLALWTGEAGNAEKARDELAALLPIRERHLGPEHPDTLVTRAHLANWIGRAGDAAKARDQYTSLLQVRQRVLGHEHPSTLATLACVALWTGNAGDPATARDMFAALLPVRERILGPEHTLTLAVRGNIARWTGEAGEPAKAHDLCAALLPVRERILGPEHPRTLADRANLAHWASQASCDKDS